MQSLKRESSFNFRNYRGKNVSIRITEVESRTGTFKVEGALHLKDAELLEKICRETSEKIGRPVTIELDNVCFVDSDGAAVICRMKREKVITIEGLNLFIKKLMELTEESECSRAANCS